MKKIISVGLVAVLTMSLGMAVFASSSTTIANSSDVRLYKDTLDYLETIPDGTELIEEETFVTFLGENGAMQLCKLNTVVEQEQDRIFNMGLSAEPYGSYKPIINGNIATVKTTSNIVRAKEIWALVVPVEGKIVSYPAVVNPDNSLSFEFATAPSSVSIFAVY